MESRVNYTLVGAFVIILGTALVIIFLWMTVGLTGKTYNTYLIYMDESVAGLSEKADVKFNGVDVGYVKKIFLSHRDPSQVHILVDIEKGTPITVNTRAILQMQGITGIAYIGLKAGPQTTKVLKKQPGQDYPVIKSSPSLLFRLDKAIEQVTNNVTKVTQSIQNILDKPNQVAIHNILHNLDVVTTTLANNAPQVDNSLKSANELLNNGAKASRKLPQVMNNVSTASRSIRRMANNVARSSGELNKTLRTGRMALENITSQLLPTSVTTMTELQSLLSDMDQLTVELKGNPAMLIRGKKAPAKGPGE